MSPSLVAVGCCVGAHGVSGCFRVAPLTDFPERFADMREMRLFRGDVPVRTISVDRVHFHDGKNQILVFSSELKDCDEAEALRGLLIKIDETERPDLPEDTYWIDDLRGLRVRSVVSGNVLGVMTDVLQTGATDVYVFKKEDGREYMFPAIREVVLRVSLEEGLLEIRPPEGLWDESDMQ